MTTDGPGILREIADEIEEQRKVLTAAITLLRRITAAYDGWSLKSDGELWAAIHSAQLMLKEFEEKGNRVC